MNAVRVSRAFLALSGSMLLIIVLLLFLLPVSAQAKPELLPTGVTRYVSPIGNDTANACTNSSFPCLSVQHAIDVSQDGDEVYVAQGVYTGTLGTVALITKSITLQGGWNGGFSAHDPIGYPTTLDGQRMNSVIFITSPITTTPITPTIDGFIVTRGLGQYGACPTSWIGSQCGGGIASAYALPIIINNTIADNFGGDGVDGNGGGIWLYGGGTPAALSNNVIVSHNVVISNAGNVGGGGYGGGMAIASAHVLLINNQIVSNTASTAGEGAGGGVLLETVGSYGLIQNNVIEFNVGSTVTTTYGAGLEIYYSRADVISNSIRYNTSRVTGIGSIGGGVMIVGSAPIVTLTDNLIADNVSHARGGGAYISIGPAARVTLDHNGILSNTAGVEGGGLWIQQSTSVRNNVIAYNRILTTTNDSRGAGVRTVGSGLIQISHNEVYSNVLFGGGAGLDVSSPAIIDGNYVHDNEKSSDWGGGVIVADSSQPITVTNNIIARNSGVGLTAINSMDVRVVNNTIADSQWENLSAFWWPTTPTWAFTATVLNNIIIGSGGCGFSAENGVTLHADYNDVQGNGDNYCGQAAVASHDISADPQFVNAATGDYHIRFGSPAMNRGTNAGTPAYDRDGIIRPQGGSVDMGAYEVVVPHSVYLPTILK